jgi:hypothetical protein
MKTSVKREVKVLEARDLMTVAGGASNLPACARPGATRHCVGLFFPPKKKGHPGPLRPTHGTPTDPLLKIPSHPPPGAEN